jgi:hypothetical protein
LGQAVGLEAVAPGSKPLKGQKKKKKRKEKESRYRPFPRPKALVVTHISLEWRLAVSSCPVGTW